MTKVCAQPRWMVCVLLGGACAMSLLFGSRVHAQEPATPASSTPDYSGVRYGPMIKLRCPEGEYQGPEPGKKAWQKDEYTWAVSRDFAQRFCMPEPMVDETLKGAEAVAFRVRPSDTQTCRIESGQEVCRRRAEFQLELYLRSDLNLPRSFPEVQFFQWEVESSGTLIQTNQSLKNGARRRAGVFRDPLGQQPPFHAFSGPDEKKRVKFMYVNFGESGERVSTMSDLYETFFHANWEDGIDLIRLNGGTSIGVGLLSDARMPPLPQRFGIGVIRQTDLQQQRKLGQAHRRDTYAHLIEVPARLSDLITAYDKQQGDLLINAARRALGVPTTPPAATDAEPVVPPVTR